MGGNAGPLFGEGGAGGVGGFSVGTGGAGGGGGHAGFLLGGGGAGGAGGGASQGPVVPAALAAPPR